MEKDSRFSRNKKWREDKKVNKYISRIKKSKDHWCFPNRRKASSWTELYNADGTFCYKSTSTPCSCDMCKGERYNRLSFKKESKNEINS